MNNYIDYGTLPSLYPISKVRDLNEEQDTYLALEIMKLFAQDDPNNFAKVRKQIGKSMRVNYFKEDERNKYKFGDKLIYNSPIKKGLKTPCIFIRYDDNKRVIMFKHAEWYARVNNKQLERG